MAHNPLSARFELVVGEAISVLTINFSQDGLHSGLQKQCPNIALEKIDRQYYKELLTAYVKQHIQLSTPQGPIRIGEGGIRLGNHQTDLRFAIADVPTDMQQLQVSITCGIENEHHQNLFWLVVNGQKHKLILDERNGYVGVVNT